MPPYSWMDGEPWPELQDIVPRTLFLLWMVLNFGEEAKAQLGHGEVLPRDAANRLRAVQAAIVALEALQHEMM